MKPRAVHYLNQFFAGLGGEEAADLEPRLVEGPVGPGRLFDQVEVVATLVAGDDWVGENPDAAGEWIAATARDLAADLALAGPAFNAGRYGFACGLFCERVGLPAATAYHPENAGRAVWPQVLAVPTGESPAGMADAARRLQALGLRLLDRGRPLGPAEDEGYLPTGRRANRVDPRPAADRAVEMLVRKLRGEPVRSELVMPSFERVAPAPAVGDLAHATLALVTTGGIVPLGNPDRMPVGRNRKPYHYSIKGVDDLAAGRWEGCHAGYNPERANEDPDRVLPLDVLREAERQGRIGRLLDEYYVVSGQGAVFEDARRIGRETAAALTAAGVRAVLLTST